MSSKCRPKASSPAKFVSSRDQSRKQKIFKLAPIAAAIMAISAPANAATIVWGGSTNDWFSGSSWIGGIIPGNSDTATINTGFIILNSPASVSEINHLGGTLSGSGTLTTNTLNWFGFDTQKGNGTTTVTNNASLGDGNYSYQHLGDHESSRTLNLNGNTSFQSVALYLSSGSVVNNNGTFTNKGDVRDNGTNVYDNGIYNNYSGANAFNNAGTFVQDASGVKTQINTTFNNTGSVNVKSGTLQLAGGGTSTGSFATQAGQTLEFAGGTHNLSSSSITSNGTSNLSSGNIVIDTGKELTVNGTSGFTQTGGTVGGSGSIITTVLKWLGYGTQNGNGTTTVTNNAYLGDGNYSYQHLGDHESSRTLNLNGNTTLQSVALYLNNGSVVNNNGTFTSKGDVRDNGTNVYDNGIYNNYSGANSFNNAGTFVQDASGVKTQINTTFNNTGSVTVKSGTLQLTGGGISTGSFATQAGQTLEFAGGTHELSGSSHTNEGTFKVSSGEVHFNSNSTTFSGNGDLQVTGGTLNISGTGNLTTSNVGHTGGTIGGSGGLITTVLNWFGYGTQNGNGTTTVNGNANLGDGNSSSHQILGDSASSRTLNLNDNTNFQSAALYLSSGSTINNAGTFTSKGNVQSGVVYDNGIYNNHNGGNTFNNTGSFVQDASGVKTTIGMAFNNTGSVDVRSGTLTLAAGGTSTGSFNTLSGQTIEFAGGDYELTGSTISNAGTLKHSGGTTNVQSASLSGSGNVQVDGGTLNFNGINNLTPQSLSVSGGTLNSQANITTSNVSHTGGTIGGSGNLITSVLNWFGYGDQSGNGTTTVNGNANLGDGNSSSHQILGDSTSSRALNLDGNTNFQSAALYLSSGSTINNAGTFTSKGNVQSGVVYDNGIYNNHNGGNTFNNTGSFVQDASGVKTTVGVAFNNTGSVDVRSGTLTLAAGGASTGSFNTLSGQTLEFAGGTHELSGSSHTNQGTFKVSSGEVHFNSNSTTFSGNGDLQVTGGTLNISGTGNLTTSNVGHTGGSIGGSGGLITTVLNWFGYGDQSGNGTTTVNGNANLGDGSSSSHQILGDSASSRTLNLDGNTNFQSAALYLSSGSTINNAGTFTSKGNVQSGVVYDNGIYNNHNGGNTFNNTGSFVQDASGVKTTVGVAFNNTGTVNIKSGTLQLENLNNYDSSTQTLTGGTYTVQNGGTLAINMGHNNGIVTNSANITLNGPNARVSNSTNTTNALTTLAANTTSGAITLLNRAALNTGAFSNAGSVTVGSGSSFVSSGDYVQTAGMTVVHGALSAGLVDIQGGSLSGKGVIIGDVSNAGLIGPGASPGTLNIQGDFSQSATGTLAIEIAGANRGISYDWLNISGIARLGGTLNVSFIDNFAPVGNSIYNIINYGSSDQSTFDLVTVSGLNLNQFSYTTLYSDTGVSLSVSVTAVPEPSTYALLFAGLGIIACVARRRNQANA